MADDVQQTTITAKPERTSILGRTSLRFRMFLINGLFTAGIIASIAITHEALQEQRAITDELTRLTQAEYYAEDAYRLHNSLRGDLYAALLTPESNAARTQELIRTWQSELASFRDDLEHEADLDLPSAVEQNIRQTRQRAESFLVRGEDLMDLAQHDQGSMIVQLPDFEARFAELGSTFTSLNSSLSQEIESAERRSAMARAHADELILIAAALIVGITVLVGATISHSIRRSVVQVSSVARALAAGELGVRYTHRGSHEIGAIGESLNVMADSLERTLSQMQSDAEYDRFNNQLADAFETADSESEIASVAERAMDAISDDQPIELLLADAGHAHLERATMHPRAGAPGCGVESPSRCVAIRRGDTVPFTDSGQLNACPYLVGRSPDRLSAICIPLSFMGRSLGVLHATSTIERPFTARDTGRLESLALNAAARIGTVRAFQRSQVQALTDSMTGLLNRRGLEMEMPEHLREGSLALILADLDHFKRLNDTRGHDAGDKALRLFAQTVRSCLRNSDRAARWGGEEFVVVLVGVTAAQAEDWIARLRSRLADACRSSGIEAFTASFGIADSSMSNDLGHLVRIADAALYMSKSSGRDRATTGRAEFALLDDEEAASETLQSGAGRSG